SCCSEPRAAARSGVEWLIIPLSSPARSRARSLILCLVGNSMPQVSTQEFEQLPLRVHTFLAGVPLHDAWFIDLPRWRAGVTLDEFLRTAGNCKLDTCGCSKSS